MITVGICGGTGSGKTTVAQALLERLGPANALLLSHDSYYRDREHWPDSLRAINNFDHPDALETSLLVHHLDELGAGRAIEVPAYDFSTHRRRTDESVRLEPRPIALVEGILLFAEPDLRRRLDLALWIEADADLRIARRMARDIRERGRSPESVVEQYLGTTRPMHREHVEPNRGAADLVIPGDRPVDRALDVVLAWMKGKLSESLSG
jgi:uridine kinase